MKRRGFLKGLFAIGALALIPIRLIGKKLFITEGTYTIGEDYESISAINEDIGELTGNITIKL